MNISILLDKYKKEIVKPYKATISYLNEENIHEILSLHPIIREILNEPEIFYFDNYDFYKSNLKKGGKILGCYVDNCLIAYGVMIFPGYSNENLGYDLNLSEDELPLVAHLDSFAVHPDYTGNKLQLKLCTLMQNIALTNGYRHLCSTVAPNNKYSLNTLLDFGFKIELQKIKYDVKLRYILYKPLN